MESLAAIIKKKPHKAFLALRSFFTGTFKKSQPRYFPNTVFVKTVKVSGMHFMSTKVAAGETKTNETTLTGL